MSDKESHIQSVIFSKDHWTLKKAKKWLRKHDYTEDFHGKGVDETSQSFRFRQMKPLTKSQKYQGYRYKTIHPQEGIAMVVIKGPKGKQKAYDKYEEKHREEKAMEFPKREIHNEDSLLLSRSQGMFNMPIELRSTIGPISDGDPRMHHLALHHPTIEAMKELDKWLGDMS